MKKISKVIFMTDGYRGGANTFVNSHMLYLEKNKIKLILIDKNPLKTFEKLSKKIQIIKLDINKNNIKNKKFLKNLLNSKKNEKFYLFITSFAFLIKYFRILNEFKKNGNKIILTLHSGVTKFDIKHLLAAFIFSFIYKKIDYLFFGSTSSKLWWKNLFPWMKIKDSVVKYNGIKLIKKIKIKKINNKMNISFVGRIEKEHDPQFFLRIAKEYLKFNHDAKFNIFGDGSLYKILKKKYNTQNIKFYGWVPKNFIYKNSHMIIITSPMHNFPYVALEAKSYGIPVISCSKGDIKKIVLNKVDGYIKYTNSAVEIVELIKKIKNNYKKFSSNSIKRSKKYEVNKFCKIFWNSIDV
jgi:glycosyltransferase involved in cell wall biosynthesis